MLKITIFQCGSEMWQQGEKYPQRSTQVRRNSRGASLVHNKTHNHLLHILTYCWLEGIRVMWVIQPWTRTQTFLTTYTHKPLQLTWRQISSRLHLFVSHSVSLCLQHQGVNYTELSLILLIILPAAEWESWLQILILETWKLRFEKCRFILHGYCL